MLTCRMKPLPRPTLWQTFTRTVPVWMAWIFTDEILSEPPEFQISACPDSRFRRPIGRSWSLTTSRMPCGRRSLWAGTATRGLHGGRNRTERFGGVPEVISSRVDELLDNQLGNITRKFTEEFGCT